ncbi:MAG: tol-pal system-associated acyl-CoA thioesterase [Pseudomonadota bacterium]
MAAVKGQSKKQFDWQVRVYYEDTDSGGVVYHSNYLKYMERARTEWLRHLGFEQTDLKDTLNSLFFVHSMQIAFKKPAKFNDLLTVTSELTTIGFGSFVFLQKIHLNAQTLIEANIKIACVDALTFKPSKIPNQLKLNLQQLSSGVTECSDQMEQV